MADATDEQLATLRLYLGERVPESGTAADTFFSDDELQAIWAASPSGGMMGAAFLGWAAKAGEYARLIDMNESGAVRNLSQRYRQANTQMKIFGDRMDAEIALTTSPGRLPGKALSGRECSERVVLWTRQWNRMPVLDHFAAGNYSFTNHINEVIDAPGLS